MEGFAVRSEILSSWDEGHLRLRPFFASDQRERQCQFSSGSSIGFSGCPHSVPIDQYTAES
jgi:hypothetical protein